MTRRASRRQFPLSCPGRSAASRRRCAAEPGSMSPQSAVSPSGSRFCAATLARCSAPGTRSGENENGAQRAPSKSSTSRDLT
ncbi:hypothetical protein D6B98_19760 [Bradyrhizobium sp. LVM 105]|nr:hypothetical protein D6B98_19760 [Bradyrhizobium sp. LVM 105]